MAFVESMWEVESVKNICRACESLECAAPYVGGVAVSVGGSLHALSPSDSAGRSAWPLRGDVCGVGPGRRVPLRDCGGGFGKCRVRACILCALRAEWSGWCTQRGEGWALAPLPHPKKQRLELCIGLYAARRLFPRAPTRTSSVESEKFTQSLLTVGGGPQEAAARRTGLLGPQISIFPSL